MKSKKEYRRTVVRFFWDLGYGLPLPDLGTFQNISTQTCAIASAHATLLPDLGIFEVRTKWVSGCILDVDEARQMVMDRIAGKIGPCCYPGKTKDSFFLDIDYEPGVHKTELAMDFCITFFEALGLSGRLAPLIGRFTQTSNDRLQWVDYGTSLAHQRLALRSNVASTVK